MPVHLPSWPLVAQFDTTFVPCTNTFVVVGQEKQLVARPDVDEGCMARPRCTCEDPTTAEGREGGTETRGRHFSE